MKIVIAGSGLVTSLQEPDLLALDLVRMDADQRLAMRTIDGRVAGDFDPNVWIVFVAGFLKSDQTVTRRVAAADGQIPFGRRIVIASDGFTDGASRWLNAT